MNAFLYLHDVHFLLCCFDDCFLRITTWRGAVYYNLVWCSLLQLGVMQLIMQLIATWYETVITT